MVFLPFVDQTYGFVQIRESRDGDATVRRSGRLRGRAGVVHVPNVWSRHLATEEAADEVPRGDEENA